VAQAVPVPVEPVEIETVESLPLEPHSTNKESRKLWGWTLRLLVMIVWGGKLIFVNIADNAAGTSLLHLIDLPFHNSGSCLWSVGIRPFVAVGFHDWEYLLNESGGAGL
jgi:hypothetical protein